MSLERGRRQENLRGLTSLNRPAGGFELPGREMDIHLSERNSDRNRPEAGNPPQANFKAFGFE
jgi:hypothetical protein